MATFINARKKPLFWPDFPAGYITAVPAGGRLVLHDAEPLDGVMKNVLRIYLKERFLIRDDGADPLVVH
jgi:hypothetical protein